MNRLRDRVLVGLLTLVAAAGLMAQVNVITFDGLAPTTTWGDIIFRGTSGNVRLAAGTSGQYLQTQGAGVDVKWSSQAIAFSFAHSTWNPAASTSYFWGFEPVLGPFTTPSAQWRVHAPFTGHITQVDLAQVVAGAGGSAGSVTLKIDLNDAGTGAAGTVGTYALTSVISGCVNFTGLSIAVTQGDVINLMDVTPAWATPPTTVVGTARVTMTFP